MTAPENTATHGMRRKEGVGDCVPSPRKDRLASTRMAMIREGQVHSAGDCGMQAQAASVTGLFEVAA